MKSKRIILTILAIITALSMGCAGMQLNWNIDKETLALAAANEVGYQLAMQYPTHAEIAFGFAQNVMNADNPEDFQRKLTDWRMYIFEAIGADPHYKRQLARFMPELELPPGEMPGQEWMDKAKPYVEEFMWGIEDAQAIPVADWGPMMDKALDEAEITTFGYIAG